MRKQDLVSEMIFKLRNGMEGIFLNNKIMLKESFLRLSDFNEDLTCIFDKEYDIVEIYHSSAATLVDLFSKSFLNLLWKREPKKFWVVIGENFQYKEFTSEREALDYMKNLIHEETAFTFHVRIRY